MKKLITICLVYVCISLTADVQANIITFDDLPSISIGVHAPIPNGYSGFNWSNFSYMQYDAFGETGYKHGCVSLPYVAYNGGGNPAMMSDGLFDFTGAYFTGAWNEDLNITIEGYQGPTLLYSKTVVASYYYPTWYTFDFLGVDKLNFSSFGGYDAEYDSGNGTQFVMDNFTFVPEPASLLLLGLGAVILRRKVCC